ncbi:hypothetical protein ACFVYE_19145 [Streptomyces sp. NPDC058239]
MLPESRRRRLHRLVQAVLHLDDLPARLDQHTLADRQEESSASPPT